MKKSFLIVLAITCLSAFTVSAESFSYERGYRGNAGIGFGNAASLNIFEGWADFETNHGFSFGNGLYVGAGIDFFVHANSKNAVVPIYAEAKYNFLDFFVSPFVDARIGAISTMNTETKASATAFLVAPMVGVDIWRFSLGFTYGFSTFDSDEPRDNQYMNLTILFNW